MILVDTSVWIDHYRNGNKALADLLTDGHLLASAILTGDTLLWTRDDRLAKAAEQVGGSGVNPSSEYSSRRRS